MVELKKIEDLLDKEGHKKGNLIKILQATQEIYGYLPEEAMYRISEKTGIKASKILGVASFYTQFRFQPVGKYLILLCQGTACHVNGSNSIYETLAEELNISDGESTEDGLFTLKNVACLGCCSLSPAMMINEETYGMLTKEKTRKIIRELREQNK